MITIRPSVEYELSDSGPTVFDCRWNTPRRMGVGDKVVACAAIQQVSAAGYDVSAFCNLEDERLFDLFGIRYPRPGFRRVIPWTDHVMAVPIGATMDDANAADWQAAHPVERALWGIGLDRLSKPHPDYTIDHKGKKKAATIAWSPIEFTRRKYKITAAEWERALSPEVEKLGGGCRVVCWCALRDQPEAISIVQNFPVELSGKITVRSAGSLADWVNGMASADKIVSANTGGMWIGLGLPVPMLVVQREPTIPHQAMWQARPGWNSGRVSIMLLDAVHLAPSSPFPRERIATGRRIAAGGF